FAGNGVPSGMVARSPALAWPWSSSATASSRGTESAVDRERVTLPDGIGERTQQMGDAICVIAHQLSIPRRHDEAIALLEQDAPHAEHAHPDLERLLDRAVGADDATVELHQCIPHL